MIALHSFGVLVTPTVQTFTTIYKSLDVEHAQTTALWHLSRAETQAIAHFTPVRFHYKVSSVETSVESGVTQCTYQ